MKLFFFRSRDVSVLFYPFFRDHCHDEWKIHLSEQSWENIGTKAFWNTVIFSFLLEIRKSKSAFCNNRKCILHKCWRVLAFRQQHKNGSHLSLIGVDIAVNYELWFYLFLMNSYTIELMLKKEIENEIVGVSWAVI